MARGGSGFDAGSLVKWGVLGVGAYWVYTSIQGGGFSLPSWLGGASTPATPAGSSPATSTPATSTTPTQSTGTAPAPGGTTPANQTPAGSTAGPSLIDQLTAAAAGDANFTGGKGNADQWNYYRNQLRPPGLTPAQFGAAFPNMTATDRGPLMTAAEYVGKLQAAGLSGLGTVFVPVPVTINTRDGRRTLVWTMNRLRGARS